MRRPHKTPRGPNEKGALVSHVFGCALGFVVCAFIGFVGTLGFDGFRVLRVSAISLASLMSTDAAFGLTRAPLIQHSDSNLETKKIRPEPAHMRNGA